MLQTLIIAAATLLGAAPSRIQQAAQNTAEPAFETASVTRHAATDTDRTTPRLQPGGGFTATNVTLRELVQFAYQRHRYDRREVIGGPSWIDSEKFDVAARAATEHLVDPDGSVRQTWSMLRTLLAHRFQLRVLEANQDRPVYALMAAGVDEKGGPRLRRTDVDCGQAMKGPPAVIPPGQGPPCSQKTPPGRLFANTVSMATFASLISGHLDRVVIDRTGLRGRFDIELEAKELKPAADYKPGPSDLALRPAAGPSIFVAVREQLGLKLEPQVAPVSVVVIESAERPVRP